MKRTLSHMEDSYSSSSETAEDDYTQWFASADAKALYPELSFFRGQELVDVGSKWEDEAAKKVQMLSSLAIICHEDTGKAFREKSQAYLFDSQLAFLRAEVLGPAILSPPEHDGDNKGRVLDGLVVMLVVSTVCKIRSLNEYISLRTHVQSVDADVVLANAIVACPTLFPSFMRLDNRMKQCVKKAICATLNLNQFVQGESVAQSLVALKQTLESSKKDEADVILRFAVFHALTRVPQWSADADRFEQVYKPVCRALLELPTKSADVVYDDFLKKRACFFGLPFDTPKRDRCLARLALMFRLASTKEVQPLLAAFDSLQEAHQDLLRDELARTGLDNWAILIYDAAAFASTVRQLRASASRNGFNVALEDLIYLFQRARTFLSRHADSGVYTLSARVLAQVARDLAKQRKHLDKIDANCLKADFTIRHTGSEGRVIQRTSG